MCHVNIYLCVCAHTQKLANMYVAMGLWCILRWHVIRYNLLACILWSLKINFFTNILAHNWYSINMQITYVLVNYETFTCLILWDLILLLPNIYLPITLFLWYTEHVEQWINISQHQADTHIHSCMPFTLVCVMSIFTHDDSLPCSQVANNKSDAQIGVCPTIDVRIYIFGALDITTSFTSLHSIQYLVGFHTILGVIFKMYFAMPPSLPLCVSSLDMMSGLTPIETDVTPPPPVEEVGEYGERRLDGDSPI